MKTFIKTVSIEYTANTEREAGRIGMEIENGIRRYSGADKVIGVSLVEKSKGKVITGLIQEKL